jgi:ABC-type amino acid transport substrate-binding protein
MKISYLFFIFLFLFSSFSLAKMPKSIRIAVYVEAPYTYFEHGKLVGLNVVLSKLLAKQLKVEAIIIPCPFARCLSIMKNGQADVIIDINKTQPRQAYLHYLPPYKEQPYPLTFFTLKSSQITINQYSDLTELIIGVSRSYTYFDQFDHDKNLQKVPFTTIEQLVSLLRRGRIDTFIAREESLVVIPEYQQYKQDIAVSTLFYSQAVPSYLAISKKSAFIPYKNKIEASINALINNGSIEQTFK